MMVRYYDLDAVWRIVTAITHSSVAAPEPPFANTISAGIGESQKHIAGRKDASKWRRSPSFFQRGRAIRGLAGNFRDERRCVIVVCVT